MAAARITAIHVGKSGSAQKAVSRVIGYIGNPEKQITSSLSAVFSAAYP